MSWEAWGDPPDPLPMKDCPSCDGTETDPDANEFGEEQPCLRCDGEGEIVDDYEPFDDDVI